MSLHRQSVRNGQRRAPHRILVVMGVSGAGKTTVGRRLAERLDWPFHDGDDLHPGENVRKMAAGEPLTDDDRMPWLERIRQLIQQHDRDGASAVLACSALKQSYRRYLGEGRDSVRFVFLRANRQVLERRLAARRGHFFDPALLASQLATLETPDRAVTVDADRTVDEVVDTIVASLAIVF